MFDPPGIEITSKNTKMKENNYTINFKSVAQEIERKEHLKV
jgi:hypothetical protein